MSITFSLTVLAWIFFRAENIGHALSYLATIFSESLITIPNFTGMNHALITFVFIFLFTTIEWIGREDQYAIQNIGINWIRPFRLAWYYIIIVAIFSFYGEQQQFIYFQF